ncbi:MAG TPA: hypothetical protein VK498_10815, partial [Ferruginibacter sp.]|nr:hypothetical protein [Ferruginibacter sp.]
KNNFHIYFYIFSILVFTGSLLTLIINWKSIFKPDWFSIIIYLMALIGSVLLLWVTNKYLVKKDRYLTEELAPKMNEFTGNADKAQIKLICGDMDFFGSSISDIDRNVQYSYLKQQQFHNILILCRQPNNGEQRVRYGKILAELGNVEIRYYRPSPQADLSIRGRIARINGADKLIIYKKLGGGYYQTIETDTGDSGGALYNNIWGLVWDLADRISNNDRTALINSYQVNI